MPFFDDSGIREDVERGAFWSAFATFAGQLERMIAVNIAWALIFAPAVIAMLLISAPDIIRLALIVITAALIPPATMTLYVMMRRAAESEPIDFAQIPDILRELGIPSYRTFAPLLGFVGFILWCINIADIFFLNVLLQLALFLILTGANYWGALIIDHPEWSPLAVLGRSLRLVWRYPVQSLLVSVAVLLASILGAISIGGLVLAVPVIIALLQTYMYRSLTRTSKSRSLRDSGKA